MDLNLECSVHALIPIADALKVSSDVLLRGNLHTDKRNSDKELSYIIYFKYAEKFAV